MRIAAWVALAVGIFAAAASSNAADVAGSQDHPLITRYPASEIKWYDVQAYQEYKIGIAPETGYRQIGEWVETAGRLHRIYYEVGGEKTHGEVYLNYVKALEDAGFEVLAKGLGSGGAGRKAIGGRSWLGTYYATNVLPPKGEIRINTGSSTSGESAFVAGKLERAEGNVYVAAAIAQYSKDIVAIMVDVIEEEPAETGLIAIDADAMSKDIEVYGKVALYGIFFDHDKATIKPESKPALDEIAKLLQGRPDLNLYVVGHTDMAGTLEYNMRLSKSRAESVVKALTGDYGIAAARLSPQGVGPLVPVFTNKSEAGKGKNRRVELVQK